jgi:hypothetical protein
VEDIELIRVPVLDSNQGDGVGFKLNFQNGAYARGTQRRRQGLGQYGHGGDSKNFDADIAVKAKNQP